MKHLPLLLIGCIALATAARADKISRWVPVSGDWELTDGVVAELSDSADAENRPLWIVAPGPEAPGGESFSATVTTRDGVGDVFLAIRWRNRDNFYALRYGDPHRQLELFKVVDGRETVLAKTEGAGKASPQQAPLTLSLSVSGNELTASAGGTTLTAHAENFASGSVALGVRYRQAAFRDMELRKLPVPPPPAAAAVVREGWRTVFLNDEKEAPLLFQVKNNSGTEWKGIEFSFRFDDAFPPEIRTVAALKPGEQSTVTVNFPAASLRVGDYRAVYRLTDAAKQVLASGELDLSVAPVPRAGRFEMILWDGIDSYPELERLGFTASSAPFFFVSKYVQEAGYLESVAAAVRRADAGLKHGVRSLLKVDTRRYWDKKKFDAMMMKDARGGNQLSGDICHNHPEYRSHLEKSVEALGEAVRDAKSPAYLLFDSETENEERKLYQCFHPACLELAKRAGFGQPPAHVNRTWGMVGVSLGALAKQAKEGVLPASTPELDYIRWWWLHGSGYVDSRALAAERLKRYLPKARAFHDPILRNPAFLGRDRGMDFVSHWTYTNPSPLGLLENIDEMRAAVDGRKPVVPNIQLFWYTNEVVGKLENAADRAKAAREADSFVEARDAVHFGRFVTISPDHVREAVWLAMSRPVDAIMLDGGSSISTTPGTYANTNPDTAEALAAVSDTLVKPYGPMLKAMNRGPGRVAVLQSAASSLYGRTGNYGNSNKLFADVYNSILFAQLQPDILFDESAGQLERYDVLIVPDTRFLTGSVRDAVVKFAASKGKLVIVDQTFGLNVPGAIKMMFPVTEKLSAAEQQKSWIASGRKLKELLLAKGFRYQVSSPAEDVILSRRIGDGDQAFFVINDARRAGIYVGQYGKVLDAGVPQTVAVKFAPELLAGGRAVYDVLTRRLLTPGKDGGIDGLFLGAGAGRLLYVAQSEITGIRVQAEPEVKRGEAARLRITLRSRKGAAGTQAVRLKVADSSGRPNALSGYYALKDGALELPLPIARNDEPGYWQVTVEDLIAGHTAETAFLVK